MPWENNRNVCFKPASGLPPQTVMLAYIKGLREDAKKNAELIQNLPEKIGEMMDNRNMTGTLTLEQITRAIENGPRFQAMANDISSLRRMFAEGNVAVATSARRGNNTPVHNLRLQRQYQHSPGVYRRVPRGWNFPKLGLQGMYLYWHSGDEAKNIPPMKFLEPNDVKHLGKRSRSSLAEVRKVMTLIDSEAKAQGLAIKDRMTQVEINTLYTHGEGAIARLIPATTPTGRPRKIPRLKYDSVIKFMQQKNRIKDT